VIWRGDVNATGLGLFSHRGSTGTKADQPFPFAREYTVLRRLAVKSLTELEK
jgi:hypothetical protein